MTNSEVGKLKVGQIVHVDLAYSCTPVAITTKPREVDEHKFRCWAMRGSITMRIAFDTPGLHLPGAECKHAQSPGVPMKGRR